MTARRTESTLRVCERRASPRSLSGAEQMLAQVSHELRGPVSAILGWTSLLLKGRLPPAEQQLALRLILRSAHVQSRLANDLMDASSIAVGQFSIQLEPIPDLAAVIKDAVESSRLRAERKRLAIGTALEAELVPVLGDPDRLHQAFSNLLTNAVTFTPAGGRIDVGCRRRGGTVEVRVRDTGRGVSPVEAARIFDRFWQGPNDGQSLRGLGLGLAITKHIVERHAGQSRVVSPGHGAGSTFVISLPVRDGARAVEAAKSRDVAVTFS